MIVRTGTAFWLVATILLLHPGAAGAQTTRDLRGLTLEELLAVEVTIVSRVPQEAAAVPAALTVLTGEDLRRSGATSLPEALRLVPGVTVGRIDASRWAIGIRGFPDRLARAMLVLIDGRAVYSPLFAGTYWEVQDVLLEDVERIEIVRGPGGTLWGANAVTGIVNIVTKSAHDTQGGFARVGTGSEERALAGVRWGGRRDRLAYRAYAKLTDRGPTFRDDGSTYDSWRMAQGGVRADWHLAGGGSFAVHGDLYGATAGQRPTLTTYAPPYVQTVEYDSALSGANLVARWHRTRAAGELSLLAYLDHTSRRELTFRETRETANVDLQYAARLGARHRFVTGAGYRLSASDTQSVPTLQFQPSSRLDHLFGAFLHDEIEIVPSHVRVAVGAKVEHNAYSGFEWQPTASLTWSPSTTQSLWLSVTRAVRTPSRVERDLVIASLIDAAAPGFLRLVPNEEFVSEKLLATEIQYRVRTTDRMFTTVSTFVNAHDDLLSTEVGTPFAEEDADGRRLILPLSWRNGLTGHSHGLEATTDLRLVPWARLTSSYSYLRIALTRKPGSADVSQERAGEGSSPRHQAQFTLSLDLPRRWEADWSWRYVSALRNPAVPAYATSNVRAGFRLTDNVEVAVVGRDLHEPRHVEFTGGGAAPGRRSSAACTPRSPPGGEMAGCGQTAGSSAAGPVGAAGPSLGMDQTCPQASHR